MRSKELDAAITSLTRLLSSKGRKPVHDERLRKALRQLKTLRKGGKLETKRVAMVVDLVAHELLDEYFSTDV
jgi:hypothetical protein